MEESTTGSLPALRTMEECAAPSREPDINIAKLYHQHKSHLLRFVQRYVYRYVRNIDDAEDIVQMTFIEAMRCADRFSGLSKPSTWLFGIALNVARNQVRHSYFDKVDTVDEVFIDQLLDEHADPAILTEVRELAGKVETLLNGLPPKIRTTFEAVLGGESTYEEAAEHLHVPVGTVRSRVSRVRAAVRAEWGDGDY